MKVNKAMTNNQLRRAINETASALKPAAFAAAPSGKTAELLQDHLAKLLIIEQQRAQKLETDKGAEQ